jgi:hypothetical protein
VLIVTKIRFKGLHCKETGVEYVPFPKQNQSKQANNQENMSDNEDGNGSDFSDNMSDLYPG